MDSTPPYHIGLNNSSKISTPTSLFVVSETSELRNVVYWDLVIDISNGDLVRSNFDNRDAFDFLYCQLP